MSAVPMHFTTTPPEGMSLSDWMKKSQVTSAPRAAG